MLGKPENPVCPLSYNKPYQKKSNMIQKLSASIFLCLWGIVSVYGNLHPAIDKDPLSIAVEAFDNQTYPYSKERIRKEIQKRNVRWHLCFILCFLRRFSERGTKVVSFA